CATTTARGPSGATASGSRSPAETARDPTAREHAVGQRRHAESPAAGDRRRFPQHAGQGPAAAAAGVLPGPAAPAGALRRAPEPDGAGPGVPDAAVPGG